MKAVILAILFISLYFAIGIAIAVTLFFTQLVTGDKYNGLTYLTVALIWPVMVFVCIIAVIVGYALKFAFWLRKKFKKH